MFSHLRASFEVGAPDDTLALFLSKDGELVEEDYTVFFCLQNTNYDATCALLWWYISDSFHSGKLLDERHYKPPAHVLKEPKSMIIVAFSVPETNIEVVHLEIGGRFISVQRMKNRQH